MNYIINLAVQSKKVVNVINQLKKKSIKKAIFKRIFYMTCDAFL